MKSVLKWGQILCLVLTSYTIQAKTTRGAASLEHQDEPLTLSEMQREIRLQHARELLGKYYKTSAVHVGENIGKINSQIYTWTRERLPKKYKAQYKRIAQTIIDESMKREFDPVFVLSVIQNESSFNPTMKGSLDEIGLMQLRPGTAKWIAEKFELKYKNSKTLLDPVENIRIGLAYMDYLRDSLPHARLYLSAYNMGKRNVQENMDRNVWPKEYASHVMRFYIEFYAQIKERKGNKVAALNHREAAGG